MELFYLTSKFNAGFDENQLFFSWPKERMIGKVMEFISKISLCHYIGRPRTENNPACGGCKIQVMSKLDDQCIKVTL